MVSQMSADYFVPVSLIANFPAITKLTNDINLVSELLRTLVNVVQVTPDGSMVRPLYVPPGVVPGGVGAASAAEAALPGTIIIRDGIPGDTPVDEVKAMFKGGPTPTSVKVVQPGGNWFIEFETDEATQEGYKMVSTPDFTFKGVVIKPRIKAAATPRTESPPYDQPFNPRGYQQQGYFDPMAQYAAGYGYMPLFGYPYMYNMPQGYGQQPQQGGERRQQGYPQGQQGHQFNQSSNSRQNNKVHRKKPTSSSSNANNNSGGGGGGGNSGGGGKSNVSSKDDSSKGGNASTDGGGGGDGGGSSKGKGKRGDSSGGGGDGGGGDGVKSSRHTRTSSASSDASTSSTNSSRGKTSAATRSATPRAENANSKKKKEPKEKSEPKKKKESSKSNAPTLAPENFPGLPSGLPGNAKPAAPKPAASGGWGSGIKIADIVKQGSKHDASKPGAAAAAIKPMPAKKTADDAAKAGRTAAVPKVDIKKGDAAVAKPVEVKPAPITKAPTAAIPVETPAQPPTEAARPRAAPPVTAPAAKPAPLTSAAAPAPKKPAWGKATTAADIVAGKSSGPKPTSAPAPAALAEPAATKLAARSTTPPAAAAATAPASDKKEAVAVSKPAAAPAAAAAAAASSTAALPKAGGGAWGASGGSGKMSFADRVRAGQK